MSSATQPNVHAALATHLSSHRVPTEEEQLFREALKLVQDEKRKQGALPKIFDSINYARTIDDIELIFETQRRGNAFWTEDIGKSWLRHLAKLAECLWQYKPIMDAVVTGSKNFVFLNLLRHVADRCIQTQPWQRQYGGL